MAYNIIIDIDQTIVDSSCVKQYRDQRDWNAAYREIDAGNVKPFAGIVELIRDARLYGHEIAFVSTSPEEYCRRILAKLGLVVSKFSGLVPYDHNLWNGSKANFYKRAIGMFKNQYQPLVIIGDSEADISAAYELDIDQYSLFTIRCLWGITSEQQIHENNKPFPYLIVKSVSELRSFLFYKWPVKQDERGISYIFNYYPVGAGRYSDIFSKYFLRDIKGYEVDVVNMPVFIENWSFRYLRYYIGKLITDLHLANPRELGVCIVPSSSARRWNRSLENIIQKVAVQLGVTDCSHLLVRHTTRDSAHNTIGNCETHV